MQDKSLPDLEQELDYLNTAINDAQDFLINLRNRRHLVWAEIRKKKNDVKRLNQLDSWWN